MKKSKELDSIEWVKAQAKEISSKRATRIVAFLQEELRFSLANRQKGGVYSVTEIDNLIDRAFDHAPLSVSRQGVAFEIWNALHASKCIDNTGGKV